MSGETPSASLRQTAVNIGLTFGRQFLAGFLQLAILLIVARQLGPEGAGAFAIALLLPILMSQLLNFGLVPANVYFVASRRISAQDAWAATRDMGAFVAIIGTILGALIVSTLGGRIFPNIEQGLLFTATLIFPFSLMNMLLIGMLQALQDFRSYNLAVLSQPLIAMLVLTLLLMFDLVSLQFTLQTIVFSHIAAMAVALALLMKKVTLMARAKQRLTYLRQALSYGLQAHMSNIIGFLIYRVDLLLVNLIVGPAAAGLYTVAVRLVEQLSIFSRAASVVILPRMSAFHNTTADERNFTPIMSRSIFWISALGAMILAFVAQPLITIFFGSEFSEAAKAALILLPGVVLLATARILANDNAARGFVFTNLVFGMGILALNVSGNLLLIPHYGLFGAAVATSISYTMLFGSYLIFQHRLGETQWVDFLVPCRSDIRLVQKLFQRRKKD